VHGKHYYFTDRESMAAQVAAGMFLEHADVHGNM
jgi:guanylate kinase